jgi:hypothetical protein
MQVIFRIRYCLLATILILCTAVARPAQITVVVVTFAPPVLPVYVQPVCPGEGYIWTPGYWAWADDGYYWVPGTWVLVPEPGLFWTPGYWAWNGSGFIFYEGYWGPEVGFYGGIDYGFGYTGHGYVGGRWEGGRFFYNRSVTNVNETVVHNVYSTTIVNNTSAPRISFNGGNGGITARPTRQEEAVVNARHLPPVAAQTEHVQAARSDQQLRASVNHGAPPIAATTKPGAFHDNSVPARDAGAAHNAPGSPNNNPPTGRTAVHPSELPRVEHAGPPNTGQPKLDQKYQQQQEEMAVRQEQDRRKLQEKQDNEHQQLQRTNADHAAQQQMEQRHQQETKEMAQKHAQEQQHLQQKQQPASPATKEKEKPPHEN